MVFDLFAKYFQMTPLLSKCQDSKRYELELNEDLAIIKKWAF